MNPADYMRHIKDVTAELARLPLTDTLLGLTVKVWLRCLYGEMEA